MDQSQQDSIREQIIGLEIVPPTDELDGTDVVTEMEEDRTGKIEQEYPQSGIHQQKGTLVYRITLVHHPGRQQKTASQ